MPRTVDLRTEIPGPKSRAIVARKERVVADAKSLLTPIVLDHAHGCDEAGQDGPAHVVPEVATAWTLHVFHGHARPGHRSGAMAHDRPGPKPRAISVGPYVPARGDLGRYGSRPRSSQSQTSVASAAPRFDS